MFLVFILSAQFWTDRGPANPHQQHGKRRGRAGFPSRLEYYIRADEAPDAQQGLRRRLQVRDTAVAQSNTQGGPEEGVPDTAARSHQGMLVHGLMSLYMSFVQVAVVLVPKKSSLVYDFQISV